MSDEKQNAGLPVSPSVTPEGARWAGSRDMLRASVAFDLLADTLSDLPDTHQQWCIRFCRSEALAFRQKGGFPREIVVSDPARLQEYFGLLDDGVRLRDAAPELYDELDATKNDVHALIALLLAHQEHTGQYLRPDDAKSVIDIQRRHSYPSPAMSKARGEAVPAIQSPTPQQEPKKGTQGGQ